MFKILHLLIDMGSCQSPAQAIIKFSAACSFEVQFPFNTVIYILASSFISKNVTSYAMYASYLHILLCTVLAIYQLMLFIMYQCFSSAGRTRRKRRRHGVEFKTELSVYSLREQPTKRVVFQIGSNDEQIHGKFSSHV